MNKEKNIIKNYLLYFATLTIICIIGASNVFAVSINSTDYATKYYWYTADDVSSTTSTEYRTGSDNRVTLYGASAPTYTNGEGLNGFYNRINYTISKGSIYTLSLAVSYSSLQENEFSSNNVNYRLLSTDFAHCSNCTITAVSGSIRRYNASAPVANNLYDYVVQMSYTFVATSNTSTWYIGSYTGDDKTMGINNHLYTSIVMVNNLEISNDNSSTIINQNDTIINQNQQMIEQNQQNTENIIDNNNTNTQDIINNNDTNTNKIIEENKKNFNDCRDSDNVSFTTINGYELSYQGNLQENSNWLVTDFIDITKYPGASFSISGFSSNSILIYNENKRFLRRITSNSYTPQKNDYYIRLNSTINNYNGIITHSEYCVNKLDEQTKTSKGIFGKLGELLDYFNPTSDNWFVKKLVDLLVNGLKSLFIPDDMSFINDFMDTLSNKLGFIASIPIRLIQFILDLPNVAFTEVDSLHFPRINIFGYYFWDDMNIDLSVGKSIFQTFKYLTDMTCVILCINTLYKWYHSFSGGGAN